MGKYIFLFILHFLFVSITIGQSTVEPVVDTATDVVQAPDETEEYYKEEIIVKDTFLYANALSVSPDTVNSIKSNKRFLYLKNLDSLLKAYQQKQDEKQKQNNNLYSPKKNGPSFMDKVLGGGTFKTILWILAVCFIVAILYQLLKGNGIFQKNTAKNDITEALPDEEELMGHDNFDLLINKALAEKDYRLAVRYHFIKTLQALWNNNHIQYEADKTNSHYVYELPLNFRNDFSKLIFQYEYVWYGHFELSEEQYKRMAEGFNDFNKKI